MTERDALYAAVLADPDSDLPRLVFADWCDDHGEADRAEFIRVQCELARRPADDPDRERLADRADALLADGHHRWKVPGIRGVQGFVRGFVSAWDGTADWLLAAAGRLFEQAPVRRVRVRNADAHVPALCGLAGLATVYALDVSGNTFAARGRLERLLNEGRLDGLRSLNVGNNRLFAEELLQLARSPVAPRLTALDLSGNPLGYPLADDGMAAFAAVSTLPGLRELAVRNGEQPDEASLHARGAEALARSANFPRLERLDLAGHHLGTDGLVAVLAGRLSERLTDLDLSNNDIGRDRANWAVALADVAGRRRYLLRRLALGGRRNRIGREDVSVLAEWAGRTAGRTLDLTGGKLNAGAFAAVLRSPWAARIRTDPPPLGAYMSAGLFATLALAVAPPLAIDVADRDPPAELNAAIRAALDRRAVAVTDGGEAALTVWFRDVLPVQATAEQVANGVGYRELPDGTLVAAVRVHRPFTDYRKQRIPAGVYTLRFAVQPEVGDHAGTSPHPEFLLLSPAETDGSAERVEPTDLLARSRKATGADHPSVMLLVPAAGATDTPKLVERSGDVRAVVVRRPATADGVKTTLALGIVVAGVSPTR